MVMSILREYTRFYIQSIFSDGILWWKVAMHQELKPFERTKYVMKENWIKQDNGFLVKMSKLLHIMTKNYQISLKYIYIL